MDHVNRNVDFGAACVKPCEDSDGGQNYKVKGTVKGRLVGPEKYPPPHTLTDYCVDDTHLEEYYCIPDPKSDRISYRIYDCTELGPNYKCVDGACVEQG